MSFYDKNLETENIENFHKLNESSQKLLILFGLIYEKISEKDYINILIKCKINSDYTMRPYATKRVPQIINLFLQKGFLTESIGLKKYEPNDYLKSYLMQKAYSTFDVKNCIRIIQEEIPMLNGNRFFEKPASLARCKREVYFSCFLQDNELFKEASNAIINFFDKTFDDIFENFITPFNIDLIQKFTLHQISNIMENQFEATLKNFGSFDDFQEAQNKIMTKFDLATMLSLFLSEYMSGQEILVKYNNKDYSYWEFKGLKEFFEGEYSASLESLGKSLQMIRKDFHVRKYIFDGFSAIPYGLLLIQKNDTTSLLELEKLIKRSEGLFYEEAMLCLKAASFAKNNKLEDASNILRSVDFNSNMITFYLYLLVHYWFGFKLDNSKRVKFLAEKLKKNKIDWLYTEIEMLLSNLIDNKQNEDFIPKIEKKFKRKSLIKFIKREEEWERVVNALLELNPNIAKKNQVQTRMVWVYQEDTPYKNENIYCKEQTLGKKGKWLKGKKIPIKRLEYEKFDYATREDKAIIETLENQNQYYYNRDKEFNMDKALKLLIGHSLLFDEANNHLEFIKGDPNLEIEENKSNFTLSFENVHEVGTVAIKETPTRFKIIEYTEEHVKIANALGGKDKIVIPIEQKEKLTTALKEISKDVNIQSNTTTFNEHLPEKKADSTAHIHILPCGAGFKLSILTRPFTEGPYYNPGEGHSVIVAELDDGNKYLTHRNLKDEKEEFNKILNTVPIIRNDNDGSFEWEFEEPSDCLEVLSDIDTIRDKIFLEWPKGEKLKIINTVSCDNFSMKVKKDRDWFGISGELRISDSKVIKMKELIELSKNARTRFIEIDDGQFLAMTNEFQKRMHEISTITDFDKKSDDAKFHNLACFAMEDIFADFADIELDDAWTKQIKKIANSANFKPIIPSTLQAELRDYQIDGYKWLARLAKLGTGACLADDMGLGKTVQALAVILQRAKQGPTLIVAPASVCFNWIKECVKFAPTLNTFVFGEGDRKKTLKGLKKNDLMVCSYGLLQAEGDLLSSKKFATIVLDEAQAIKNRNTKRSKAAMQLQTDFRIITTGTPIENHLGELWNLFTFINPGLLGSIKSFNEKFSSSIVKDDDKDTKNALKKMIAPFILRRRKTEVLEELPPKTEITLSVELEDDEKAFYEALRQETVDSIANSDAAAGTQHLKILAELMKLRRACCHPKLVNEKVKLKGSKLALFGKTVDELIENKHKCLVFSQFVGHLDILRKYLDKKKIKYQYLDGSTPTKKRQERVDAFQNGEGDLFLISLKAGGTGLNLTAADYVIHMDPWWNPAVEDQASDRAHRIGQERPVTIYRLVTKDTIEEKIVNLHKEKKDLADSLLEGSERSGKLSTKELLNLIKE